MKGLIHDVLDVVYWVYMELVGTPVKEFRGVGVPRPIPSLHSRDTPTGGIGILWVWAPPYRFPLTYVIPIGCLLLNVGFITLDLAYPIHPYRSL